MKCDGLVLCALWRWWHCGTARQRSCSAVSITQLLSTSGALDVSLLRWYKHFKLHCSLTCLPWTTFTSSFISSNVSSWSDVYVTYYVNFPTRLPSSDIYTSCPSDHYNSVERDIMFSSGPSVCLSVWYSVYLVEGFQWNFPHVFIMWAERAGKVFKVKCQGHNNTKYGQISILWPFRHHRIFIHYSINGLPAIQ